MNRTRRDELPKRSDILHIIKRWDKVPFQTLRHELNVSTKKLLKWSKLIFDNNSKEQRWKEIEDNLNQMEMVDSFESDMASEYDVHSVHRISNKRFYVIKKKLVNESRQCYMVTLNHSFNYLVRFDIPVLKHTIEFCPVAVGCDYDVHPVGQWEFMQLQHDIPVVDIVADDQYTGAFWLAMNEMLEHAQHEA